MERNLRWKSRSATRNDWGDKFAVAVWWIWRWRNEEIFEHKSRNREEKISWINSQHKVATEVFKRAHLPGGRNIFPSEVFVMWMTPEMGWHKVNVDGRC